jgi:hypothetical protein
MRISSIRRGRLAFAAIAVLPALALAGCGGIDPGSVESAIKKQFQKEGATAQTVKCPGSIADKASQTINCSATVTESGGKEVSGTVTVTLEHTTITKFEFSAGGGATPATPSTPATTTT